MTMRFKVGCLLLALLLAAQSGANRHGTFAHESSFYCPTPKRFSDGKEVVAADFQTACKHQYEAERKKLAQLHETIQSRLDQLVNQTVPLDKRFRLFVDACMAKYGSPQFRGNNRRIDELRYHTMVAAIEAGRIAEAVTQYVILRSLDAGQSVVNRIYANPARHRKHIENLIVFIRTLPVRHEQIEYFHQLRGPLIAHNDHESYLGALFAFGARRAVFAEDGKTALNETDERELCSTMIAASAGYFKRSLLVGETPMDLVRIDRDFPALFTMLFPKIVDISKEDLRKFNAWKMVWVPCTLYRARSMLMLFREAILLLQRNFAWKDHNYIHAPRMAGAFKACLPQLEKDPENKMLVQETKALFKDFSKGQTYDRLVKILEQRLATRAG